MMGPFLKGSIATLAVMFMSEAVYKLYGYMRRRRSLRDPENESKGTEIMEVFFFPDKAVACKNHFLGESPCFKKNCKYSHGKTSLSVLFRHLNSCKKTMDICMFVLTCTDLVDIVLTMHRRGFKVRVITDSEQEKADGSQIWTLRMAGIRVRTNSSSFLMHHKFVIVDEKLLINGSFNWTRQAITGNQENVFVTNHHSTVLSFQAEFEKLWQQFDPDSIHNSDLGKLVKGETFRKQVL